MSVTYDSLSVTVKHRIGTTDTVADTGYGNQMYGTKALQEFLRGDDVEVANSPLKLVPFHAIEYVTVEGEHTTAGVSDSACVQDCDTMTDPTLIVPDSTLNVNAGEEFDALDGVVAYDGNGNDITPTVTAEEQAEGLLNEDSIEISDENDDPLTVQG